MPAPQFKQFEQILQQMINVIVSRTTLNDITDSSVMKHLLAAPAREMDEIYYQLGLLLSAFDLDSAVGEDLDQRAAEAQPDGLLRIGAAKASGTLVFSRGGTSGTVLIPTGTTAKTTEDVAFVTTAGGSIADGDTESAAVAALAVVAGAAGNVPVGAISRFDSRPLGVDSVTNPATFVGGLDKETDDALRRRIKAYQKSLPRSMDSALEFVALGSSLANGQRVAFAHVVNDDVNRGEVTLYLDDGSGTIETTDLVEGEDVSEALGGPGGDSAVGGEIFLYLNNTPVKEDAPFTLTSGLNGVLVDGTDFIIDNTASRIKLLTTSAYYAVRSGYPQGGAETAETFTADYTHYTGLLQLVQKIVNGDPDDRVNFPGWRAAGVRVHVRPPAIFQQLVTANILAKEGYTKGVLIGSGLYTAGSVLDGVQRAISGYINGLGISGDVLLSGLIAAAMAVPGVTNVSISVPSADITMLDDQLPRVTAANIILT